MQDVSGFFRQQLAQVIDENSDIFTELRGLGLLIGLKCTPLNSDVVAALRHHHVLSVGAGENTLRLLPPLNVTREEIAVAIAALQAACVDLRAAEKRGLGIMSYQNFIDLNDFDQGAGASAIG